MYSQPSLKKSVLKGSIYTAILTSLFLTKTINSEPLIEILTALPFFIVLYFLMFTLGRPSVSDWLRNKTNGDIRFLFFFPVFLVLLYFGYLAFCGLNPFQGVLFLVPYLLFFPVLAFAIRKKDNNIVDWLDFVIFFLFFLPVTLIDAKPSGNLPINGGGFDSVYRIAVILAGVFGFVTIRNLRDVGFYPVLKWKHLFTTFWVWLVFYAFVFVVAYQVDFIKLQEGKPLSVLISSRVVWTFLSILLHTALFEELVFRGLLQNMLHKRIARSVNRKAWQIGGASVLLIASLIIGYSMNGNLKLFPAIVTLLLFAAAMGLERKSGSGIFTAMAITSVIFGLAHAHAGSIIFVGLAAIGGWAYGYVYYKTTNVFYAALLHAMVNSTPLIFGLELAK